MATLWVTGANGVLGAAVVQHAVETGAYERICALSHTPDSQQQQHAHPSTEWYALDVRDRDAFAQLADTMRPDAIVNCAAMTNVDACEVTPELAWQINADGPRTLAYVARDTGAQLLHVSTDYVFPGHDTRPGPYGEGDEPAPLSVYGRSKLGGEEAIAHALGAEHPYLIMRTAVVIGIGPNQRPNFVTWLARELRLEHRVKIVNDQYNTPTLANDLARAILWNLASGSTGVYHAAGPTLLGRHEWALAIADYFGLSRELIEWVTTEQLGQKAQRPLRSGLRCQRLAADYACGLARFQGAIECLSAVDWQAHL